MRIPSPEESIFQAALDILDQQERIRYVEERSAGNLKLQARVFALLDGYQEASFLEEKSGELATVMHELVGAELGETIGPYKLLETIGEGGMGLVFMAQQSKPLQRRVALKVIKPGLDSRMVVARFEAERQALALMDHPNIAKVFDAGSTNNGRPYVVMELVRGQAITDYCVENRLDFEERITLFIDVCDAVQHAHQKGVIHRDLKPGNVLVTRADTGPIAKVIDFGIAKAISCTLTENTLFTGFNQILGTPLYMSPEQADVGNQDVDTRSDVYSLGVILYELLTDTLPFDRERFRQISQLEVLRLIREEQPPKPSDRTTARARAATTAGTSHTIASRKSASQLRGDLDWIVMKAMEKDRTRRYESPSLLAADLKRYIRGEPVEARPPTVWYLSRKLILQHKQFFLASALVAVSLTIGLTVSISQTIRARRAESDKDRALTQARQAVDEMYTNVAEEWLDNQINLTDLQRQFLARALSFYESFTQSSNDPRRDELTLVRAMIRVGILRYRTGDLLAAKEVLGRAREIIEHNLAKEPHNVAMRVERLVLVNALCYVLPRLAQEARASQLLGEAVEDNETAISIAVNEVELRRRWADALRQFAANLSYLGHSKAATRFAELSNENWESLVKLPTADFSDRRGLATSVATYAKILSEWGDNLEDAATQLTIAEQLFSSLMAENLKDRKTRTILYSVLEQKGFIELDAQRYERAAELFRRCLTLTSSLVEDFPALSYGQYKAGSLQNLGSSLDKMQQVDEAFECYQAAVDTWLQIYKRSPTDTVAIEALFGLSQRLSIRFLDHRREPDFIALSKRLIPLVHEFSDQLSASYSSASYVAVYLHLVAAVLIGQEKHEEAFAVICAIPASALKYVPYDESKFPEIGGSKRNAFRDSHDASCASFLLVPAFLLEDCAALARTDEKLSVKQRELLISSYLQRSTELHDQALQAMKARTEGVKSLGKGDALAFEIYVLCEQLISQHLKRQADSHRQPECIMRAYDRVGHMLYERLVSAGSSALSESAGQQWLSRLLSLAPTPFRNQTLALQLANRGEELSDTQEKTASAWARYRLGQYDACVDLEDESLFFKTMALWQLGQKEEAEKTFETANNWLKGFEERCAKRASNGRTTYPTPSSLKWVQTEAAELIHRNGVR